MFYQIFNKNIYKSSYFKNLIFSYLFILVIPLCCTIYLIFNIYLGEVRNSIQTAHTTNLNQTIVSLDREFQNVSNVFTQLNLNSTIKPFLLEDSPNSSIRLQEQLRNAITINKNVFEIFLYFKTDTYMHSSSTSVALDYFDFLYNLDDIDSKKILKSLNDCKKLEILPSTSLTYGTSKKNIIPLIYPYHSVGTLMVFMDVGQLLSPITSNDYAYFSVLDQKGTSILSTFPDSIPFETIQDGHQDNVVSIDNKKYLYTLFTSSSTGLSYIYLTDYIYLFQSLHKYILIFILIILLIILLLIYLANYFANKNYYPIHALKNLSNTLHHIDFNKDVFLKNEFLYIQSTLEYLNNSNKKLTDQYEDIKYYGYDSLLFNLLNGSFDSLDDFNQKGKSLNIQLAQGFYTSLVIRFTHDTLTQNNVYELLSNHFPIHFDLFENLYIQKHLEKNKLLILVTQPAKAPEQLVHFSSEIRNFLIVQDVTELHIGIGNTYSQFQLIPKSYIEAFNALKYRFIKSVTPIIYFSDCILDEFSTTFYTTDYTDALKIHIKNEDLAGISLIVEDVKHQFIDRQLPLFAAQGICFDIINDIFSYFNRNLSPSAPKLPSINFYELSSYDTLDKLFEFINATCFKICNALNYLCHTPNTHPDNMKIKEMLQYIEFHCYDPDFSTSQMASNFNMSAPALSSYFKNITGQTISTYLTDYRLTKAKEMLLSTNLPLAEICKEVGYYNVSSFIRRFKNIEGISPGAYRDMHQSQSIS